MTSRDNRLYGLLILIACVALIVFRHVDFFINPRFWAEEGQIYFADAYVNGLNSIFHPHLGYFSIIPNIATFLAAKVSLSNAPLVTTLVAFVVQVIPFYLIFISKSSYFDTTVKKLSASLIVLFVAHSGEVWLNSINSQFHMTVILFLILIDDSLFNDKLRTFFSILLVVIAGLSGIPANILAPFFFLRFIVKKDKWALVCFLLLAISTLLQIYFVLTSEAVSNRFVGFEVVQLLKRIVVYTFQYPIIYRNKFNLIFVAIPLIYFVFRTKKDFQWVVFIGSALLLSVIMIITSLGMKGGGRYAYAPSVILVLWLHSLYFSGMLSGKFKKLVVFYMAVAVIVGVSKYPLKDGTVYSKKWKKWKDEVALYEAHKTDEVALYPQWDRAFWKMELPRK